MSHKYGQLFGRQTKQAQDGGGRTAPHSAAAAAVVGT